MPSVPEWMCTRCLGNFSICRVNHSNGSYGYYRYCSICNRKLGSPIAGQKIREFGIEVKDIPVFQPNRTRSEKDRAKLRAEAARDLRKRRLPVKPITVEAIALQQMPYQQYLQSAHWIVTRQAALKRALYRCAICNSNKNLQVHHRTYERLGHEKPEDLTVLCEDCHSKFHNIMPKETL